MIPAFARWPASPQGRRVVFSAACPCGREVLWEQRALDSKVWYSIACRCEEEAAA